MKVLLDSNGLQAAVYLGLHSSQKAKDACGRRLTTLLSIIKNLGCDIAFTDVKTGVITNNSLIDCSVLVITTRRPGLPRPSESELETIRQFVQRGGGLLIMSNHPWPHMPNPIPDLYTASLFGVTLNGPIYKQHRFMRRLIRIQGDDLCQHSITDGLKGPIVFRNGCRINTSAGNIIAMLPGEKYEPNIFAVAVEEPQNEKGRVVVTADSGFIADDDTNFPGQGLIHKGCNMRFIRQVFEWLLKQR